MSADRGCVDAGPAPGGRPGGRWSGAECGQGQRCADGGAAAGRARGGEAERVSLVGDSGADCAVGAGSAEVKCRVSWMVYKVYFYV